MQNEVFVLLSSAYRRFVQKNDAFAGVEWAGKAATCSQQAMASQFAIFLARLHAKYLPLSRLSDCLQKSFYVCNPCYSSGRQNKMYTKGPAITGRSPPVCGISGLTWPLFHRTPIRFSGHSFQAPPPPPPFSQNTIRPLLAWWHILLHSGMV